MFTFIRRLFKPKQPEETPEERAALERATNNIMEFLESVNREYADAYIELFCPWVDYDAMSKEDQKRLVKVAVITHLMAEGVIESKYFDPLEMDEFKDLIPEPTPEEYIAYLKSYQLSDDAVAELCAAKYPETAT